MVGRGTERGRNVFVICGLRGFFAAGAGASSSALRDAEVANVAVAVSRPVVPGGVATTPSVPRSPLAVGLEAGVAAAEVSAGPGLLGFFMKNLEIEACLNPPPAPPPVGFSFGISVRYRERGVQECGKLVFELCAAKTSKIENNG